MKDEVSWGAIRCRKGQTIFETVYSASTYTMNLSNISSLPQCNIHHGKGCQSLDMACSMDPKFQLLFEGLRVSFRLDALLLKEVGGGTVYETGQE